MTTVLDVVVPVHDEEAVLTASVHRLHLHLVATFPYPFRITIADNASTDGTWQVAQQLVATLPAVAAVRLEEKGRGRALKRVWSESDALVLAYMDVDLSTDLDALWPLVAEQEDCRDRALTRVALERCDDALVDRLEELGGIGATGPDAPSLGSAPRDA